MTENICLDKNFSTTRLTIKEKPNILNNPNDNHQNLLFFPVNVTRVAEGGGLQQYPAGVAKCWREWVDGDDRSNRGLYGEQQPWERYQAYVGRDQVAGPPAYKDDT